MVKTVMSKSGEVPVIIQMPADFPEKTDGIAKKLRQILAGLSRAVKEANDGKIAQRGIEILEKNLAKSASEILELLQTEQKVKQE